MRRAGRQVGRCQFEIATLEYADWFNTRRLHSELGDIPPIEHETNHYRENASTSTVETREPSLHRSRRCAILKKANRHRTSTAGH